MGNKSAAALRLQRLVEELLDSEAYSHPTTKISLRQSHISYVLLTGDFAYKIKKPVSFGFVDYSTLARRRHYCHEEVRLNRRLAPDMYLGVIEISKAGGRTVVGAGEKVLEYAVKMMQLPEDRMMDRLLAQGRMTAAMVARLAEMLSEFYRHARTDPEVEYYGTPEGVLFNARENFDQLSPYVGRVLPAEQLEAIRDYTVSFVRVNSELFADRIRQRRIRDGHGDLRAGNICFSDKIRVFDCVEFNERLRFGDVASDIAFLVMDLDYAGYPDLSRRFVEAYLDSSGDRGCADMIGYYKTYRACVRAKVECLKLDQPEIPRFDKELAAENARKYFNLAASYVRSQTWPRVEMLLRARSLLHAGHSVILDASFLKFQDRRSP